jgi:hypothetical protein
MKLDYNLGVIIEMSNARLELDSDETNELIIFLIDGVCPFCLVEISYDERACCDCLASIYSYHQNHHACHNRLV